MVDLPSLQVHASHMHGTGTPLGDPIEMGGVAAVLLAKNRSCDSPLLLAAHKSSAGHAEAAAGLVGLACATLALENASVPSILHLRFVHLLCHQAIQGNVFQGRHRPLGQSCTRP